MFKKMASITVLSLVLFLACKNQTGSQTISLEGTVETEVDYIRCQVPARVASISTKKGAVVKKGDLLLSLNNGEAEEKLAQLKDHLSNSRKAAGLARKKLHESRNEAQKLKKKSNSFIGKIFSTEKGRKKKKKEISEKVFQSTALLKQSKAQNEMLSEKVELIESALKSFEIKSPVDGIVSVLSVEKGDAVKPGQILVTIAQTDTAYFRSRISGHDKKLISLEDEGILLLDEARDQKPIKVKVEEIEGTSAFTPEHLKNEQERLQYAIRLAFLDKPGELSLKPGAKGVAKLEPGDKK